MELNENQFRFFNATANFTKQAIPSLKTKLAMSMIGKKITEENVRIELNKVIENFMLMGKSLKRGKDNKSDLIDKTYELVEKILTNDNYTRMFLQDYRF